MAPLCLGAHGQPLPFALQDLELPDTAAGRRRFLAWTEGCIDWRDPAKSGDSLPDGQSLHSTLRRGWYFGGEEFREKLVALLGRSNDVSAQKQKGYHGEQARDHGLAEAERIVSLAEEHFDLNREQWTALKKSDWRKGLVAGLIRQRALIDNGWLAERLHMGARNAVSRIIQHARELAKSERTVKKAAKALRKNVSLL